MRENCLQNQWGVTKHSSLQLIDENNWREEPFISTTQKVFMPD